MRLRHFLHLSLPINCCTALWEHQLDAVSSFPFSKATFFCWTSQDCIDGLKCTFSFPVQQEKRLHFLLEILRFGKEERVTTSVSCVYKIVQFNEEIESLLAKLKLQIEPLILVSMRSKFIQISVLQDNSIIISISLRAQFFVWSVNTAKFYKHFTLFIDSKTVKIKIVHFQIDGYGVISLLISNQPKFCIRASTLL